MARQFLRNRLLTHLMRIIYLRIPTIFSSAIYLALRTSIDPRKKHFEKAFKAVADAKLTGDYLEFGSYQGSSFIMAFNLSRKYNLRHMKFHAFDSFDGLPEDEGSVFHMGDYRCSKDLFSRIIKKGGVDMNRVNIIDGFYQNTLTNTLSTELDIRHAAIVNVDCDLYSSTKPVLNFIEDLLLPGSVVIFDDWHAFDPSEGPEDSKALGEERAFNEWSLKYYFHEFYDFPRGKAFVMFKMPE